MTITQKKIIQEIPHLLTDRDFSLLLALRNMCHYGWGMNSHMWKKFDDLIERFLQRDNRHSYHFDVTDWSITQVKCYICFDRGTYQKRPKDEVRTACQNCNKFAELAQKKQQA